MTTRSVSPAVAAVLDLVCVVVFAAIGRASHGEDVASALVTAWPFLAGTALGWALWWGTRRVAPTTWRGGVVVWLCTVAGGMLLRAATGQGTAFSFVVVTAVVTAVLLLGWRLLVALLRRGGTRAAA